MTTFKLTTWLLESNQDLGRNKQNLYQKREIPRWCVPIQETKKRGFDPWVRKIPWSRKWPPTPVFLPGKSHEQRSLVGYSPMGLQSQTQLSMHAQRDTRKY